jgi:hypothetical protein
MKEDAMTDNEIRSLARNYIDSSLAEQGAPPSSEAYDAAVAAVEAETRKLAEASGRRHDVNQEAVAC